MTMFKVTPAVKPRTQPLGNYQRRRRSQFRKSDEKFLRSDKRLLSIILFALAISGVIAIATLRSLNSDAKKRRAIAAAEIISTAPTNWNDARRETKYGFRVNYRFQINGRSVDAVDKKNQFYKPGEQYLICYDPKDAANSKLHSLRDADCGKGFL